MITVLLLLVAGLVLIFVYLTKSRGIVTGRTALLPGQTFEFRRAGPLLWIWTVPTTTIRWNGVEWDFALVKLPSGICRAYILHHPPYTGRRSDLNSTHRLADGLGRTFVCWDPEPTNPNDMASALALWVAATSCYLQAGVFPSAHTAQQALRRS
jgi:hypothetical protein